MLPTPLTITELEFRLAELGESPKDNGTIQMIVCRPDTGERITLETAELDVTRGLIGDNWQARGSRHTEDGSAHPDMQITLMNSRIIQAIASDSSKWALAGDQLYVDLDLSQKNLPIGQRIAIGTAILQISPIPHTGCGKFNERFGSAATKLVNSREGRSQRRRGVNARVIQPGTISVGDKVTKL